MNFLLSEEEQMLRDSIRDFAQEQLKPHAMHLDETGEWPTENINKMKEMGLMGMCTPQEYDGSGMDYFSYILASEEVNRACAASGVVMSVQNSLVQGPILKWGTENQKKKYLPALATGEKIGCYCLTEPMAGSDAANQQTLAIKKGDKYILNGSKIFITNGSHAETAIVFATTSKELKYKGICAFIVERGFPGYKVGALEHKMGINASGTTEIYFEDCEVPAENLLGGKEGIGFTIAMNTLDFGRIGIAAQAVGIGQACLDEAIKYSQERQTFGKPLAAHQAIQFKLADMATQLEAARLLTYRAAWMKMNDLPCTKEASMAKLYASEACNRAAYEAVQIHGGYGYMREYTVERLYRDARITTIYEGTSEVQRLVVAKNLG